MTSLSTSNAIACLLLLLLALFAFFQPVGYLGSGLVGAIGAKAIRPTEIRDSNQLPQPIVVNFLRFGVIGFSLLITGLRHFGVSFL